MRFKTTQLAGSILAALLIALPNSGFCQETSGTQETLDEPIPTIADFYDLDLLRSNGDDWEIVHEQYAADAGRITLYHNYWLMYFLHWRPLSEIADTLSAAYVEHHLLNFWGESMPFELTGTGGTTVVDGHKAYFVDGTIYDGRIQTRFIVWNCEQTGRQFTSDCNVNLSVGTNPNYLREQEEITRTICCHGTCGPFVTDSDNQLWKSKPYNLSFVKPHSWRTNDFAAKTWFPDGPSDTNATLWTLPTDSEKRLELIWRPKEDKLSADLMRQMLNELVIDTTESKDTVGISNLQLDSASDHDGRWYGDGTFGLRDSREEETYTDNYDFGVMLWSRGERTYLLVIAKINVQERWGRPVDLRPRSGWKTMYYATQVRPSLKVD
jgi:hypothetical protein